MKKRIILSNILILVLSLVALLIGSNIIANKAIEKSAKEEIKNYLNIAVNYFNGTNIEETATTLTINNEEIRITFIDASTYEVIYDYGYGLEPENLSNHKDRPELMNLGNVFIRESETLNIKMMYIASVKNGVYIRVAIPLSNLNELKTTYSLYALFIFILVSILSVFSTIYLSKITMKPINAEIKKFANIVDSNASDDIDIDELPNQVEKTRELIQSKIDTILEEKEKLNFVINIINQGFIVLDNERNIFMINNSAKKLFNYENKEEITGKNFIYLCHDSYIINDIKKALNTKTSFSSEHIIEGQRYFITFNYLRDTWNNSNINSGVSITIMDYSSVNQVDMMKKDFFANASHELKTPLTTIIGNLQMISQGIISDSEQMMSLISNSEDEAKRISNIVSEMLELAYLESDTPIETSKVNLVEILDENLKKYDGQIKNKNITVVVNKVNCILNMNRSDANYLLSNLIDNAIKYNKDGGSILVTLKKNSFTIKDTGIGIVSTEIDRIFERFYRVDKSRSRGMGGTGLGLSIVKHICNRYHFDIKVDSTFGDGTTFKVVFK